MKGMYFLVVMSLSLITFSCDYTTLAAEQRPESTATTFAQPTINVNPIELENAKFEFNKQLERDKLAVETQKAWLTGLSVLIPLVLGVLTLAWQSKSALVMKKKDASDAFQLKAAELVLDSATPAAARSRAEALKKLFPEYLPSTFADSFDFSKLPGIRGERKLELMKMLVEHSNERDQIVHLWRTLYPEEDEWLRKLVARSVTPPDDILSKKG